MRIAIVVGHNSRAQGAVNVFGESEYVWNGHLAEMIAEHGHCRIFRRTPGGGYSREIDRVYASVDEWGADCSLELHFNGAASPHAQGCLTLTSGTTGSRILAREVHERCLAVMQGNDRGIEARGRQDRGGRSLWQGRSPAIMTEPFFGSNAEEARRANARVEYLAEAIWRGAAAFCKGE